MENIAEITLYPSHRKQGYIPIYKAKWDLFPPTTTELELEAEPMDVIQTQFYVEVKGSHRGFSTNLKPWFIAHPELNAGATLRITMIKPNNRYCLEILK